MESEVTPACTTQRDHPSDTTLLSQPAHCVLFVKNQIQCEPSGPPHLLKHTESLLCAEPRRLRACNGVRLCAVLFVGGSEGSVTDERREMREEPLIAL
ncbi:hypothetical protein NQZ68_001006 [Dissostichus eleginoides]|nr:hypothetical protein NQZ68_001006 [Dissostichus eleginoides]